MLVIGEFCQMENFKEENNSREVFQIAVVFVLFWRIAKKKIVLCMTKQLFYPIFFCAACQFFIAFQWNTCPLTTFLSGFLL